MSNNRGNSKKISKGAIIAIIAAGILIFSIILVLLIEAVYTQKVVIKNNTNKDIESIQVYFDSEEDAEFPVIAEDISIKAGEKISKSYKAVDMGIYQTELTLLVTFEGGETMMIYDGEFTGKYKGRIEGEFFENNGQYYLRLKAGVGLSNSTESTFCDTDFILDIITGDWDYSEEELN